jgi:hexosaminidase
MSAAIRTRFLAVLSVFSLAQLSLATPSPTELRLRGYSVIPSPQKVMLQSDDIDFDGTWAYRAGSFGPTHIAVRSLLKDLREFHGLTLKPAVASSKNVVRLAIVEGTVKTAGTGNVASQGYLMKIAPGLIEITGNGDPGLLYGVQSLLQLLKPGPGGRLQLPAASIEDWPEHPLRFLHWDTKHHQDRIETLKRFLDWSARFKINRIGFELEDKFEYPSHPIIGAPGAFTTAQLQEIVNYGLERFIQVVPQVQSPAHMAYVLKHPEFADLRADGSNYQSCDCDPRTEQLIFSMYDDVIKATQGVDSFFVSTDEVYYAGICSKCTRPYNPENRSLAWVEFVQKAHNFLKQRGRQMFAWVEYPFMSEHTELLPPDLIDGVLDNDPEEIKRENQHGLRHLAYTSIQGAELLFPNYFLYDNDRYVSRGHLTSASEAILLRARAAKPIGVFGAAWDDSGLHNETFWLGWTIVAQNGWAPGLASTAQTTAEFMDVFYGPRASQMVEVYQALQRQARFFEGSWDRVVSRVRGPGYGNSYGKGIGTTRYDQTLPRPALPALPGLDFTPIYNSGRYGKLVDSARTAAIENDLLMHRIQENIGRAERNRYNLEVLLSLAEFTGHQSRLILGLRSIEDRLQAARDAAQKASHEQALGQLVAAYGQGREIIAGRKDVFANLKRTWEKSRYPKGQEVNGRKFVHVLDDVKDHWADRRADLSYMIAPEESIGLEKWMEQMGTAIQEYARTHNLPVRPLEEIRLED